MIVQAEQGHGGDWEFADSKIIDGMVLDISDENYRGEYAEEAAVHHGYGSSFYYASDYLDILPDINLPSNGQILISGVMPQMNLRLYMSEDCILTRMCWRYFITDVGSS